MNKNRKWVHVIINILQFLERSKYEGKIPPLHNNNNYIPCYAWNLILYKPCNKSGGPYMKVTQSNYKIIMPKHWSNLFFGKEAPYDLICIVICMNLKSQDYTFKLAHHSLLVCTVVIGFLSLVQH